MPRLESRFYQWTFVEHLCKREQSVTRPAFLTTAHRLHRRLKNSAHASSSIHLAPSSPKRNRGARPHCGPTRRQHAKYQSTFGPVQASLIWMIGPETYSSAVPRLRPPRRRGGSPERGLDASGSNVHSIRLAECRLAAIACPWRHP